MSLQIQLRDGPGGQHRQPPRSLRLWHLRERTLFVLCSRRVSLRNGGCRLAATWWTAITCTTPAPPAAGAGGARSTSRATSGRTSRSSTTAPMRSTTSTACWRRPVPNPRYFRPRFCPHVWTGCRRLVPRRPLRAPGAQQEPAEPPAHRRAWVVQLRGRRPQQLHAEQPVIPVPRRYRRGCSLLRGRADPVALGCRHRLPCATTAAAQPCLHHRLTLCWMCQCTPGRTAGAEGTDLGAQNVVYRPVLATRREGIHLQSCVCHPFCQCILH